MITVDLGCHALLTVLKDSFSNEDYTKAACVEANTGYLHCYIETIVMMYNQNFLTCDPSLI